MGQYYVPVLMTQHGDIKTFYSHEYDNGLKLMEHSYIGNDFVAAVLHYLTKHPYKLFWLGDYAEMRDFKNHKMTPRKMSQAWSDNYNIHPKDTCTEWKYNSAYVINLDKSECIKLQDISNELTICPIPILTAVGNGKGGGDYLAYMKNL